jgi:prephenate dehydratase
MDSYPTPALALVETMREAAAAEPARAVAFQGAPGANSHRAALEWAPEGLPLPCFAFEDALDAVTSGAAGSAMIPIENSQHGRVADIHFLLPGSGLSIVGEHFLPISYAAMGLTKGPYKVAHSHPQALGQTRLFLRERGIVPLAYADTAGAAALVREQGDPAACAIAPALAAGLYGLEIAEDHVEDAKDNTTRFVVLAREPLDPATLHGAPAMTTFVFEVRNVPAALYWALSGFAANGVNMTKLESYQQGASFSATMFYADIVGAPGDPAIDHALAGLRLHSKEVLMLGSYPQARPRG